ncbi:MAG: hypothetical protein WBB73_08900 [Candidatus Aminicenantaceae bacterium]
MKTAERYLSFTLLGLLTLGVSFCIYAHMRGPGFSILEHGFKPQTAFVLVWFIAAASAMVLFWLLLPRAEQSFLNAGLDTLQRENLTCLMPAALGLLIPLMLTHYLTAADFRTRLHLLTTAMLAGFLVLKGLQYHRHLKGRHFGAGLTERFNRMPKNKRIWVLFLAAFLLYNLGAAILVSGGRAFAGDEPYYLLTTDSLYQDLDINLSDQYGEGDHVHFYPPELYPNVRLRAYARFGRKGEGYIYSINQPGVSALILPWYALSQLFKGRTLIFLIRSSLTLWAALLGVQIYLLFIQLWRDEKLSLFLWFLYSFTVPVFFFAFHIYPTVPITFFSVYIFRKAVAPNPPSRFEYAFCGFLLALFPFFGLKYNMIFWPLLLIAGYYFVRRHKAGARILLFLAFPLAGLAAYYLYVYHLYGTFNPIAIYEGVLTPDKIQNFRDIMRDTPLMLRIDSFLDYFLDQRDGLLLYAPWYFFALAGFIEMFRRARTTLLTFALLAGPYLFNYAFFAHRQGSSPQARVLTPLSWMAAVAVGYFILHNRKRLFTLLFRGSMILSFVFVFLLLWNPSFLYQPTTHAYTFRGSELFVSLSNLHFYLPDLLPSFLKLDNLGYIPNYVWLGLILVFAVGYAVKRDLRIPQGPSFQAACVGVLLMLFFAAFCLYPRPVLLFPQNAAYSSGERLAFYAQNHNIRMTGPGTFELTGWDRSYELYFTSWRQLRSLKFTFGPGQGEAAAKLDFFDVSLFSGRVTDRKESLMYADPPLYRYRNTNLYLLRITLQSAPAESPEGIPFELMVTPQN